MTRDRVERLVNYQTRMKGIGPTGLVLSLALLRRSIALSISTRSLRLVAFRGRSRHTRGFQPSETFALAAQELIASACQGAGSRQHDVRLWPTEGSDVFCWVQSSLGNEELAGAASRSRRFTSPGLSASWSLGVTSYGRSSLSKAEEGLLVGGVVEEYLSSSLGRRYLIRNGYLSSGIESLDSDIRMRIIEDTCPPTARNLPRDVQRSAGAATTREKRFYICRELQTGAAVGKGGTTIATACGRRPIRGVLGVLALKRRLCRGPTAIEPEVALVMANFAKVRPGSLVLDPFCGSCSLLLPAANMGAKTWGSDVRGPATAASGETLKCLGIETAGRGRAEVPLQADRDDLEKIHRDYRELGLVPPTLGAADVRDEKSFIRKAGFFDAIVTDPPYNIKAKVVTANGTMDEVKKSTLTPCEGGSTLTMALSDSWLQKGPKNHEESLSEWQAGDGARAEAAANSLVGDVIWSLISLARYTLKPGGRLSFFLPLRGAEARLDELPRALLEKLRADDGDARLVVVYMTKQRMTSNNMCRWLVVLEKQTKMMVQMTNDTRLGEDQFTF